MERKKNNTVSSTSDRKDLSPNQLAWLRFKSNKTALFGLFIIFCFLLVAIAGPYIRPDSSYKANAQYLELARKGPGFRQEMLVLKNEQSFIPIYKWNFVNDSVQIEKYTGNQPNDGEVLLFAKSMLNGANPEEFIQRKFFPLGTDRYGRDLLSRLMAGTWISFTVGFISIFISLVIGLSLGASAGFYRGKWDDLVMWLINVVWSIPTLLLVIAITLALGKGFWQVFVAVGLTMWVEVARVVRGQVLSIREKEYVEAGNALGYKNFRIISKHILPNVSGPVIVISAANFAAAILIEAGLSFLGLGAQPPQATWGKMIAEHKGYIITGDAYLAIFPGIAIFLLVLSFVLLGNGLKDAFDGQSLKSIHL